MKNLAYLFLSFLFAQSIYAGNLCDASCELTITFPDGGSIDAVEVLTLSFGTSGELVLGAAGTINTAVQPVSTDYLLGGSLVLAKGESITFGGGGYIVLGDAGNIDHLDMAINSSGNASLQAVGGTETITIESLAIGGGLNITLEAKHVIVNGSLEIDGATLNLIADTSTAGTSVCSIQGSAGITISSSPGIDTTDTCNTISTDLGLAGGVLTVGTIDPNDIVITGGTITLAPSPIVDVGDLTIEAWTQELLSSLSDGTEVTTEDGSTCVMAAGECIDVSGVKYSVVDGKIVAVEEGAGSLHFLVQLLVISLLIAMRPNRGNY